MSIQYLGVDRAWWSGRSSKPRRRRLRRLRWVRFPHAPATAALGGAALAVLAVGLGLALLLGVPTRAVGQDTTAARAAGQRPDSAALPAAATDSLRTPSRPLSPLGALWRSFLVPGWGQAKLNRKLTGGIFVAWEGVTLGMALKTRHELAYLRRTNSGRGDAKRQEHEDWIALLVFNHLFAGLESYVSAHLTDFPGDLRWRAAPGGVAAAISVPLRLR